MARAAPTHNEGTSSALQYTGQLAALATDRDNQAVAGTLRPSFGLGEKILDRLGKSVVGCIDPARAVAGYYGWGVACS